MSDLYLIHHGIQGQKWGVRRFQNPDGSLTAAGRARYLNAKSDYKQAKREYRSNKDSREARLAMIEAKGRVKKSKDNYKDLKASEKLGRITRQGYREELKTRSEEIAKENNRELYKQYEELQKEQRRLASKYDFDLDDGGGGTTKESQIAGKKYAELLDKSDALEDIMIAKTNEASKKAEKELLAKYGDTAIHQINRANEIAAVTDRVSIVIGTIGGFTIGASSGHPIIGGFAGASAGSIVGNKIGKKIH